MTGPGRKGGAPAGLPVRVVYKDKRHSSGYIRDGEIVLYISSRLPPAVARQHVADLTRRLQARVADLARAGGAPLPPLTPSGVTTDADLQAWAQALNARYYGFPMGQVRFRKQASRWGSCSGRTRNIYISHRLRGGPLELLEYVLVHEICHLQEMNHGPRFWQLVARASPDYQERRRLLVRWGLWLAQAGGGAGGGPGGEPSGEPGGEPARGAGAGAGRRGGARGKGGPA